MKQDPNELNNAIGSFQTRLDDAECARQAELAKQAADREKAKQVELAKQAAEKREAEAAERAAALFEQQRLEIAENARLQELAKQACDIRSLCEPWGAEAGKKKV